MEILRFDLDETGFDTAEIDGPMLLDDEEGFANEVPAPRPLATSVSRAGNVCGMGNRRLARGDARDAALHDRLMPTDPPYNVGRVASNAERREFALPWDKMSPEEFAAFDRWTAPALERLVDGGPPASFSDWRMIELRLGRERELGSSGVSILTFGAHVLFLFRNASSSV